jgi:hypothetical protein
MVRHPGYFTRYATPAAGLDSIEALAEIFSLHCVGAAFFEWSGMACWNYLAASPGDFETSAKAWAMKIHGAAAMAVLVLIGMLLTAHVRFAWRARRNRANGSVFLSVCRFDHHRLWPLLRRRRKSACVDELDSSHRWLGFANLAADPHRFGKEDTLFGSTSRQIELCISGSQGSTSKVPL